MTESEAIERLYNMKNKVDLALMNSKHEKGHWLYDDVQGTADTLRMAIKALEKQIKKENADGCVGCAFEDVEEWEMPCRKCKRGCKDYWRAKE